MKISYYTPVSHNRKINGYPTKQVNRPFINTHSPNINSPAFTGISFEPIKNIFKKETYAEKLKKEAIEVLKKEESHGLFAIGDNFFEFTKEKDANKKIDSLNSEGQRITHVVIKNPPQSQKITSISLQNPFEMKSSFYSYRPGITPLAVLFAIEKNLKSIVFVTDDKIHELKLPENSNKLIEKAEKVYENLEDISSWYLGEEKTESYLKEAKKMVNKLPGVKLSVKNLSEK